MLKGLKDIPDLKEKLNILLERTDEIKLEQKNLKEEVYTLQQSMQKEREERGIKIEGLEKDIEQIKSLKEELEKTLRQLQNTQSSFIQNTTNNVGRKIEEQLLLVRKNTQSFRELEPEVKQLQSQLISLKGESLKLTAITKKINTMDFELTNYTKKLEKDNSEKIRLLKQIDDLKNLIARERRRR